MKRIISIACIICFLMVGVTAFADTVEATTNSLLAISRPSFKARTTIIGKHMLAL